jgi:6-phosphogluconolactonase
MREMLVLNDPARAAAERLARAASAGGHVALAGGSTPRAAYEQLAGMEVDWSRCTIWFGDERCVPPDDDRSNFAMVQKALLDGLSRSAPDVRRIKGERGPQGGADSYEDELRAAFAGRPPAFDLVLLGLGPDAHCASLFPDHEALEERRRLAVGVDHPSLAPLVPRVTLTLPALNAARDVLFLVTGEEKAMAVRRAFSGRPSSSAPASLVRPSSGRLTVLLDAAAAAHTSTADRS